MPARSLYGLRREGFLVTKLHGVSFPAGLWWRACGLAARVHQRAALR